MAANVASGVISELRHLGAQPTVGMAKQGACALGVAQNIGPC